MTDRDRDRQTDRQRQRVTKRIILYPTGVQNVIKIPDA